MILGAKPSNILNIDYNSKTTRSSLNLVESKFPKIRLLKNV